MKLFLIFLSWFAFGKNVTLDPNMPRYSMDGGPNTAARYLTFNPFSMGPGTPSTTRGVPYMPPHEYVIFSKRLQQPGPWKNPDDDGTTQ